MGGDWPELGYLPPLNPDKPLPAGQEITFSDVFLRAVSKTPDDPRASARLFLDSLADIYPSLERPEPEFHDWPRRARETLRDLENSEKATVREYGYRYIRPYTNAEQPDSMVQLNRAAGPERLCRLVLRAYCLRGRIAPRRSPLFRHRARYAASLPAKRERRQGYTGGGFLVSLPSAYQSGATGEKRRSGGAFSLS